MIFRIVSGEREAVNLAVDIAIMLIIFLRLNEVTDWAIRITLPEEAKCPVALSLSGSSKNARRYFGYFALISNEKMDAFTAWHLYRMKDIVEKAFGNIKERLNMRRILVSSARGLDGKLFVEFVALILISYIHQNYGGKTAFIVMNCRNLARARAS